MSTSYPQKTVLFAAFSLFVIAVVWPVTSVAQTAQPAQCAPDFSACAIPEKVQLVFPFLAIAGDVTLVPNAHANLTAASDLFHIDNNFIDTGLGTGIGFGAFLFSGNTLTLPAPSTYSANFVEIRETPEGHGPTQYFGNGTDYFLDTGVTPIPRGGSKAAAGKIASLDLADGPAPVAISFGTEPGQGPEQDPGQTDGLAFYSTNYTSLGGTPLPFNIVGTNPAHGAATTTIPTVIVPINVTWATEANLALNGSDVVSLTENSPIFLTADYMVGGTDLGTTQFGDALQRAEFHNIPGFSQDYHVLLGTPTIAPPLTITVTSPTQGNLYRLRSGRLVGVLQSGFLDSKINALVRGFTSNTLPIFLTDNTFESDDGTIHTCCILGFHNSQRPPATTAKTWIYTAHTEANTFVGNVILDVQPLSHEVSEWLNDPFVGALKIGFVNLIPPAVLPNSGGGCIINFETGDPLEFTLPAAQFTQVTNGTTYHLQDEVLLPWYLHTTPSFSVNGQYSFQNTATSFSSLCGPG